MFIMSTSTRLMEIGNRCMYYLHRCFNCCLVCSKTQVDENKPNDEENPITIDDIRMTHQMERTSKDIVHQPIEMQTFNRSPVNHGFDSSNPISEILSREKDVSSIVIEMDDRPPVNEHPLVTPEFKKELKQKTSSEPKESNEPVPVSEHPLVTPEFKKELKEKTSSETKESNELTPISENPLITPEFKKELKEKTSIKDHPLSASEFKNELKKKALYPPGRPEEFSDGSDFEHIEEKKIIHEDDEVILIG